MDVRTELKGNTCKSNLDFSASTGDSKKQRGRYGRERENNTQSCKMVSISQLFLFRKKEIETVYFNPSRFSPVFVLILSMIKSSQVESFLPCKFFLHFPTLVRQYMSTWVKIQVHRSRPVLRKPSTNSTLLSWNYSIDRFLSAEQILQIWFVSIRLTEVELS